MKEVSLRIALIILGLAVKALPFVIELSLLKGIMAFALAIGLITFAFLYKPGKLQRVSA